MSIQVAIKHTTHYQFDHFINVSPHIIRLKPAPHCRTPIISYSLNISPKKHFINWQQDPFGNFLARVVFPERTNCLSIEVEVIADLVVINPFDFFLEESAETFPFSYSQEELKSLSPYLEKLPKTTLLSDFIAKINQDPTPTNTFLVELNQQVQSHIDYAVRMEPGVQTPEETLQKKRGSCRDSAWLLIQVLRHLGLAARFTSGYLVQLKQDEKPLEGPAGTEADFTDLHAWCEVYLPGAGWVGLDPTSGLFAGEGHIPLASTPSPSSAAPITGATEPCEVSMKFSNKVTRIHQDPRVTLPYSENEWQQILTLGKKLDLTYEKEKIHLTMGGEPTFISIDDMESAQWNTEALGKEKWHLATQLATQLKDQFSQYGLLYQGQGKWYPNEPLPRWALNIVFRNDQQPLWQSQQLLSNSFSNKVLSNAHDVLNQFSNKLVQSLGFEESHGYSLFEDRLFYQREAEKLPSDIDLENCISDEESPYFYLAHKIKTGLKTCIGRAIPLAFEGTKETNGTWLSCLWPIKNQHIILIPGDSPAGLRLPINSLPEGNRYQPQPKDPFDHSPPLFNAKSCSLPMQSKILTNKQFIISCLTIEVRLNQLHVFMPPLEDINGYLALIHLIETTAIALDIPVVIEGYDPPKDKRITKLSITPDPGVIEVNIQPCENFAQQVELTTALYAQAKQCRLTTVKYMLDGRQTGTGGGNHITLGGASPKQSPFLKRPDLLQSFITYWQHHPSLSYLFSSAFIGPTSQAPRVDEGRDEALYELELAFNQLKHRKDSPPWLVDRLFRNLLVDVTGNTHRAEFCIDKLYSPSSPTGRLGLLEFRGFEMPPHSKMSLVQVLLIRCLFLRFWQKPYQQPLIRFGTRLHDEYMLPYYIMRDMAEVVDDLNYNKIPFKLDWLKPFETFRFPYFGRLQIKDITLTLRWAIEPWHVLAEEVSLSGTSRFVDSSVERLQVYVENLDLNRYQVLCNGVKTPLHPTQTPNCFVAGVRYKAWSPPSSLHPTIKANTPLKFDILDTWNNNSIGGCTYHVAHPGGRNYDTYPVNGFEAEGRRINRFGAYQHSQSNLTNGFIERFNHVDLVGHNASKKAILAAGQEYNFDYPHTLDLRWVH